MTKRIVASTLIIGVSVALSSCATTSQTSAPGPRNHGPVDVLYAGSLVGDMNSKIESAFSLATGYEVVGFPGASTELANQIKSKLQQADIFISAAPQVNKTLEGKINGDWVTWYANLAKSPLVIGYNPDSAFAGALKSKPWYEVLSQPGFKLGRTDPSLDPKGTLTIKAVQAQAQALHNASLVNKILGSTENPAQVFPEETLVARLESGQLDAGFFYANEARLAGIQTVSIGAKLGADFTITILSRPPHPRAAIAFVDYLYSKPGQTLLAKLGLTPVPPAPVGSAKSIPKILLRVV